MSGQGTKYSPPTYNAGSFQSPYAPQESSGSLFGSIMHVLGQGTDDIINMAKDSPAGIYHGVGMGIHHPGELLSNMYHQTVTDFEHPLRHPGYTLADILSLAPTPFALADRGIELGRTAAGASSWAKTAAEDTALSTSTGRQALQALLHGSPTPQRFIKEFKTDEFGKRVPTTQQSGMYFSHNLGIRQAQKLLDQLHETHPDLRIPGLFAKQSSRVQRAMFAEQPINTGLSRVQAALLVKKFGKATDAQHEAVAIVGRLTTPDAQAKFIRGLIADKKVHGFLLKNAENWLKRTEEAKQYLEDHVIRTDPTHKLDEHGNPLLDESGQPVLAHGGGEYTISRMRKDAPGFMHDYEASIRNVSDMRTKHLIENGYLDPQQAMLRTIAPKSVIENRGLLPSMAALKKARQNAVNFGHDDKVAELDKQIAAVQDAYKGKGQMTLDMGEHNLDLPDQLTDPELAKLGFRVPERADFKTGIKEFTRQWKGGRVAEPDSLKKEYLAQVIKHGGPASNSAKLVAESYIEAQRFLHLSALRKQILAVARDTPAGIPDEHRLALVEDSWRGQLPVGFQYPQSKLFHGVEPNEMEAVGRFYEPLRQVLMDPKAAIDYVKDHFSNDSRALKMVQAKGVPFTHEEDLYNYRIPGIKWIDDRMLGGLNKQNPLWSAMERPGFRKFLKTTDFVNEVQKTMMLYLRPAYLTTNMLGNVALSLIHGGFLAPLNLGKTLKVLFTGKGLSREAMAQARAVMGDGLSRSLSAEGKTLTERASAVNAKIASGYGKIIDDPFRLAALMHEARRAGFTTLPDLEKLLTDPKYEARLRDIGGRANDALINYERLGPAEQAIMRRLVFFYPWAKGSSRYAYQLVINHPTAAFATSATGQSGEDWIHNTLGDVPSYAEGVFPFNGHEAINPSAAGVMGTFAQSLELLKNTVQANPNQAITALDELSPADSAFVTAATGLGQRNPHQSRVGAAVQDLQSQNPIAGSPNALYESVTGGPARDNSLYGDNSKQHAILRYFLGGLAPRDFNKDFANYRAYLDKHPHG